MENKVFKITLIPCGQFFFGGETVFGGDGQAVRRRSYLVESNLLPQQTSLLGMLREQLLTQNQLLLDTNSDAATIQKAVQVAGVTGFSPAQSNGYGLIKVLSPVALEDKAGKCWTPAPLDDQKVPDQDGRLHSLQFDYDDAAARPVMHYLNPKYDLDVLFDDGTGKRRKLEALFQAQTQTGITITNRTRQEAWPETEKDEAYYRQTFRRNSASAFAEAAVEQDEPSSGPFSFVFWVEMSPDIDAWQFSDAMVNLGGEQSTFRMKVTPEENRPLGSFLPQPAYQFNTLPDGLNGRFRRIVLLSDAYVDSAILKKECVLSVNQTIPFRFFSTTLGQTSRYYDVEQNIQAKQLSGKFTLLRRGSVLYTLSNISTAKTNPLADHLQNQTAFRNIGYNYFNIL